MANILVVDDDTHIREVVTYALEQDGHRVQAVDNGLAALSEIRRGRASGLPSARFDLIVLDILMPDLDGLSVCRQIREHDDVPIIFLSSRAEEFDRILGLDLGADDYLAKPFSPRELATRVRVILRRTGTGTSKPWWLAEGQ